MISEVVYLIRETSQTNKQTNKHTNKQTNKQTYKHTHKCTDKHTNKQMYRQTNKSIHGCLVGMAMDQQHMSFSDLHAFGHLPYALQQATERAACSHFSDSRGRDMALWYGGGKQVLCMLTSTT